MLCVCRLVLRIGCSSIEGTLNHAGGYEWTRLTTLRTMVVLHHHTLPRV